jgi:hypothetical protein
MESIGIMTAIPVRVHEYNVHGQIRYMPMSQAGSGCWRDGDNEPVRVMLDSKEEVARVLESHGFWFDDENMTVKAKLPESAIGGQEEPGPEQELEQEPEQEPEQEQENIGVGSELHVERVPTEHPFLRADRSEQKRGKKKGA